MTRLADAHALLAERLPETKLVGDGRVAVRRVHSDTRSVEPGDLFVALKGERHDAHDFLSQAREAGAVAALAERGFTEARLPGLMVRDTGDALGALAAGWRSRMVLPLIAVTGSNGKTTVTQMIASILAAWHGDAVLATIGNLNNHIGVPLTLLRLRQDASRWHRAAVIELGMNHVGEIAELAALAAPTVALVNNAQREHQEFMASVEAVARENGAAIEALPEDGVAVFPAGDAYSALWAEMAGGRRVWRFALGDGDVDADVSGMSDWQDGAHRLVLRTPAGNASVALRIAGRHNAKNALAATACALAAGAPLEAVVRGLEAFEPVRGRSQLKRFARGASSFVLVDDSYNANPDSVRAAIDVLAELPGPRWLVLGDMGEVGDEGPAFHREVGAFARDRGIDVLWTAGALSAEAVQAFGEQGCGSTRHFDTTPALIESLFEAPACASVLVKGSRFMKMERVVTAISDQWAEGAQGGAGGAA